MTDDGDVCEFYKKRHNVVIDVIEERYGAAVAIDIMDEVNERMGEWEKKRRSERWI